MKGVVPQKGKVFQMKISVNSGPHDGFTASPDQCKQLSNFLWDWYDSIPKGIASHIEVITVNMTRSISVKVILSGSYQHHYYNSGLESVCWKTQFDEILTYPIYEGVDKKHRELTNKLRRALEAEIKTYQPLLSDLSSMFESMAVRY